MKTKKRNLLSKYKTLKKLKDSGKEILQKSDIVKQILDSEKNIAKGRIKKLKV